MSDPRAAERLSRRTLLRRAGAGGLSLLAATAGCARPDVGAEAGDRGADDRTPGAPGHLDLPAAGPLTRPILRGWSDDIVWIDAPLTELPIAYVSMALRQVFVDRAHRDRAAWLLDAHISVSTWHWRIRLPGDSPAEPITPGDTLREFEELDIGDWEPSMVPSMDDIRIRRGAPVGRRTEFACLPATGERDGWYRGGPWDTVVAGGSVGDDATREEFRVIGTGERYATRACSGESEVVQFVTWSTRRDDD